MALVVKDRVKETTTTTGTGTYTLAGASTGYQSFSTIGNANTTYYCVTDGTNWEVTLGTYTSAGTTLSRDTILASSNGGAAVSWTAGTRDVFCVYPAGKSVYINSVGQLDLGSTTLVTTGGLTGANLNLSGTSTPAATNVYSPAANAVAIGTNSAQALVVDTNGVEYTEQPTPTALTATGTLTIANLQTKIITVTSTTAVSLTLPTGTLTDAGIIGGSLASNMAFEWYIVNLGSSSGAVTLVAGTGHTIVGATGVAIATSAQFRTRKTAANTYVTYRIS